jgi:hypothetical protein
MNKKPKFFKWTVEIEISEVWVADGYEVEAERLKDTILEHSLGYAFDTEVKVKVLSKPSIKAIRKVQGYEK